MCAVASPFSDGTFPIVYYIIVCACQCEDCLSICRDTREGGGGGGCSAPLL